MSVNALKDALAPNPAAVRAALGGAEKELRELRARQTELEGLINQAREVLGIKVGDVMTGGELVAPVGGMKLHEAMEHMLRASGPMSSRQLADAINDQGLYRQKRGNAVPPSQISARANRYSHLFKKDEAGRITLQHSVDNA